ncbi:cation:proton antiporter [Chloroflexota bacterium]
MEEIAQTIAFVGILVFLAHFFTGIFSRTKIPDVILLILIGICVGPVLGLTSPTQFGGVGPVFTYITLIIILFESGLTLRLTALRSALGGAVTLAPLSFFFTMGVVAGFALWLTELELIPAFILGAIAASTSGTVVIPLVRQLGIREETQTLLSVESSLNDVLSIVVTVALVEAYVLGEFQVATVSGELIASLLVAIVFGIIGALVWSILLNKIHAIKNTMFTTPAFVFVIFGIVETLGFSGAIAALAFGVTLGNIKSIRFSIFTLPTAREPVGLTEAERIFFGEVAFLLKTFFFVFLGISLELISGSLIVVAVIMTVLALMLRIPAIKLSVRKSIPAKDLSIMAIMVPKGLAAVVLAAIPLQQGITGGELIKNVTYGIVLFSIMMTSFLVLLLEKTRFSEVYSWFFLFSLPKFRFSPKHSPGKSSEEGRKVIPTGSKLFGRGKTED